MRARYLFLTGLFFSASGFKKGANFGGKNEFG